MQSSLDHAGFAQLCGRSPIMREIMRAHNRMIPRSLQETRRREKAKPHFLTHPVEPLATGVTKTSSADKTNKNSFPWQRPLRHQKN